MVFEFALASAAILSTVFAILLLHLVKCGKKKKDEIKPRIFERAPREQAMDKGDIIAKPHDYPTMEDVKSVWNTVGAGDDDKDSDTKPDSKKDGAKGKSERKGKKADGSEKKDAKKAGGSDDKKVAKADEQKESDPKTDGKK